MAMRFRRNRVGKSVVATIILFAVLIAVVMGIALSVGIVITKDKVSPSPQSPQQSGTYSILPTNETVTVSLNLTSSVPIGNITFVFNGTWNWSLTISPATSNELSLYLHATLPWPSAHIPPLIVVSSYAKTIYWLSQIQEWTVLTQPSVYGTGSV